jgi:hypothetical protein
MEKQPLVYQSTKIDPIFKSCLDADVSKKSFQSVNHAINAALFNFYKHKLTVEQIEMIRSRAFGVTKIKGKSKKQAPTNL